MEKPHVAEPALDTVHGLHLLPQLCREGATGKILKFNLLRSERTVKDTPCERLGGLLQEAVELQGCSR